MITILTERIISKLTIDDFIRLHPVSRLGVIINPHYQQKQKNNSRHSNQRRGEDEAETGEELQEKEPEDNEHEVTQAINDQVTSIKIKPRDVEKFDVLVFYSNIKDKIKEFIISHSPVRKGIKWYLVTRVEFTREKEGKV